MTTWRRVMLVILTLWVLVSTNPGHGGGTRSFRKFLADVQHAGNHHRHTKHSKHECHNHLLVDDNYDGDNGNSNGKSHHHHQRTTCIESRRAYPELSDLLDMIFAPHRRPFSHLHTARSQHFESVDYGLFTLIRAKPVSTPSSSPPPSSSSSSSSTTTTATASTVVPDISKTTSIATPFLFQQQQQQDEYGQVNQREQQQQRQQKSIHRHDHSPPPPHAFLGILGIWLPYPDPARMTGSIEFRNFFLVLRTSLSPFRVRLRTLQLRLPARPWEWLNVLYVVTGVLWLIFPARARDHLVLTWPNVRDHGRWWCLLLSQFSHGGSLLRLCRSVIVVNFLAPPLARALSLSSLYGVVLTSSATATALAILVLLRRYVLAPRDAWPRAPLEINAGGACVYALLVAACLGPSACEPFPAAAGVRPFELLMLNVLFDSFFLAGKKRIADYTAHTGAALGSWLFYSVNMAS